MMVSRRFCLSNWGNGHKNQKRQSASFGLRLLFSETCGVLLRDGRELALFSFDDLVFNEEVVYGVGWLSSFAKPVLGAFHIEVHRGWVCESVVRSQDLERFTPWVARFFTHDETILWALGFADAR